MLILWLPVSCFQMASFRIPSPIPVQRQPENQAYNAALNQKKQELQQKSKEQHPQGKGLRLRVAGEPMTSETVNDASTSGVSINQTALHSDLRSADDV